MGFQLGNRTKQTWTGTGTGTLDLAAAGATVTGYQSFADALANSETTVIVIASEDESQVEICETAWTEATQLLTRGTLIWSTTGSRIDFAAGTKNVWIDVDAAKLVDLLDGGASTAHTHAYAPQNPLATDSLWDAKGDLVGGTGANTAGKLTVGTNGKVLVAASGETTGLKWAYLPDGIREYQPTAMQPLEATAPAWEVVDFGTVVATVASFDDTAEEYLNGKFIVPANIDTAGTVTFEVTCSPKTGAASKNVAWTFGHAARATGESIDASYVDEDSGDKAITATTGQQTIMTWTETVANLGWAAGDVVYFRLSRDPAAGTDLTGDCYLLMFRVLMPTVL